ncbi:MAG TPA: ABC transporter ATP-binding protein [Symbiobacteriaceae bacterium]|nr:ABC transporter ATP-binding protein [Symbiobacteriaceae bacterium]
MTGQAVHLSLEQLAIGFGGIKALEDVSLAVQAGSITTIIGPNGAGKTSLINCISGRYIPQGGRVIFAGQNITRLSPPKRAALRIARTFQNIALFRHMTVLDNLMVGRHVLMKSGLLSCGLYWGAARREEIEHRRAVEEIIDFLEIAHIRRKPVGTLSYGMQKRVELGRALALEPKLLLLDEPMAGMNSEEKEDMVRFILEINQERGVTCLLIEHDMGVVMDISDRVAVLDFGRKIAEGTPEQVKADPAVVKAYLGAAG